MPAAQSPGLEPELGARSGVGAEGGGAGGGAGGGRIDHEDKEAAHPVGPGILPDVDDVHRFFVVKPLTAL